MCGRFYFFGNSAAIQEVLPGLDIPHPIAPRYNIAPGQPVAVIPNTPTLRLDHFLWGLVPSWAKEPGIGMRLINARAETLAEKPAFRAALRRRRCLILADGFYEWFQPPEQRAKIPLAFRLHPPRLFAFAGLWEVWQSPDGGELYTVTIITTAANAFISQFHQRMPVILEPADYAAWLDPEERTPREMIRLLSPLAPERLEAFPVSPIVNNARIDQPVCLEPVGEVISYE
ncbi:MAG TPA: SOS response-associated peptidase [Armatimonadota bacterium]|jgi:putative SOS response-associated peptidase YedK